MLLMIHMLLKKSSDREDEEVFIIPKVIICGISGFFSAAIFDALFKYFEYGTLKISGITFYGGLIGAITILYIQLQFNRKYTHYNIKEWFDLLTLPLIIFHFFGRIGCFFAGCCYGKITESHLGVIFPDNIEHGIIHNGLKRYPTQLFEAVALLVIFILVSFAKNKFQSYLASYASIRFFLEFFRGDDRGYLTSFLSPAQIISIVIILNILFYRIAEIKTLKKCKETGLSHLK